MAIRADWVDLITAWNREGIRWRDFTATEMLWMMHQMTFDSLRFNHKSQVRDYLNEVRDYALLARWDNGSFQETDMGTGGER